MKRRCPAKEKREEFIHRVQQSLEAFPHDRVIHGDETNWRVVTASFWTWADTEREVVSYIVDENEKEGITVIAEIYAADPKLPFAVAGKGKTQRCLVVLNLPLEV
jgi:hypothetical protein